MSFIVVGKIMVKELKKAIIESIFEDQNEFQIVNYIKEKFRQYIYDDKGEYLIGGEKVVEFINEATALIIN